MSTDDGAALRASLETGSMGLAFEVHWHLQTRRPLPLLRGYSVALVDGRGYVLTDSQGQEVAAGAFPVCAQAARNAGTWPW